MCYLIPDVSLTEQRLRFFQTPLKIKNPPKTKKNQVEMWYLAIYHSGKHKKVEKFEMLGEIKKDSSKIYELDKS